MLYKRPDNVQKLLETLLGSMNLTKTFKVSVLAKAWGDIMGPVLSQKTRPNYLKSNVLNIVVTSHVWKQELEMQKKDILDKIKAKFPDLKVERLYLSVEAETPRG